MAEDRRATSTGGIRKLTSQARGMLRRQPSGVDAAGLATAEVEDTEAGADVEGESAELAQLSSDMLREELHVAIDAVMDRHAVEPRDRGALKDELDTAIHQVVDEHLGARSLMERVAGEVQATWNKVGTPVVTTADSSIDAAMGKLQVALQLAYGHSRPGAVRTMKLMPTLVSETAKFLVRYTGDEKMLRQIQPHVEKLLVESFHTNPKVAHTIVDVAIGAAKNLQGTKGEKNSASKAKIGDDDHASVGSDLGNAGQGSAG